MIFRLSFDSEEAKDYYDKAMKKVKKLQRLMMEKAGITLGEKNIDISPHQFNSLIDEMEDDGMVWGDDFRVEVIK